MSFALMESSNTLSVQPITSGPFPHPPIQRRKAPELTRDQRRDITLLHSIGWSYNQIRTHLSFQPTFDQIKYACKSRVKSTPKKRSGRPPVLTQAQVEFVCASRQNRRMSFAQLVEALDFGGEKTQFI